MNVSIDQPWHQDTATAVDDLVIADRGALGNLANKTAFHNNVSTRSQRFRFAIEDAGRSKYNSSLHFQLPLAVVGQQHQESSLHTTKSYHGIFLSDPLASGYSANPEVPIKSHYR
jgi:hypothetical protein